MRPDGRAHDELRPFSFERDFTAYAHGSVLVSFGDTKVLCTAMLDEDVPPGIAFHTVLPTDWADHMWETLRLPMLHLDQEEKALVRDMLTLTPTATYVGHTGPSVMLRSQFAEVLIGGDSGNPAFLMSMRPCPVSHSPTNSAAPMRGMSSAVWQAT